ncbi:MAG: DNA alkylation repair protein [Bacteroidia bacterium]|nr:DNA alkylation repair protein [Bacteroidia bacterium]
MTRALRAFSSEEKKAILPKFFKTKEGEYGFGDKFMGVTVPCTRKVAKQFSNVSLDVVEGLLESEWHECRLCALLILVEKFSAHIKNEATISKTAEIVEFYLSHTQGVNNWDLVDLSAPYILGKYLLDKQDRSILYTLAQSENMWEQRISIVATLTLIRNNQLTDTLKLAESFLATRHNLIQKATGWMLREVGKKDEKALIDFLNKHKSQMPRTMLRYAIERFNPLQRKEFMG